MSIQAIAETPEMPIIICIYYIYARAAILFPPISALPSLARTSQRRSYCSAQLMRRISYAKNVSHAASRSPAPVSPQHNAYLIEILGLFSCHIMP